MPCTEFYCNASIGSNMNGGSDENASPSYSATNGGWNSGTGVFTPTSGNPSLTVTVGQFAAVFVDGATTPGFVGRVTAVNSTTVTVSITVKTGTVPTTAASGISINVGGVWKGPNGTDGWPLSIVSPNTMAVSSNPVRFNLKNNATYSVTAQITLDSNSQVVFYQGYTTTAGDGGKVVIDGGTSGASFTILRISGARVRVTDFIIQNNGATGSADGIESLSGEVVLRGLVINNVRGSGIRINGNNTLVVECETHTCNQSNTSNKAGILASTNLVTHVRCIAHDNSGSNTSGFLTTNGQVWYFNCISDTNGSHGFANSGFGGTAWYQNCVAYNNTSSGIAATSFGSDNAFYVENCLLVSNGAYGFTGNGSTQRFQFYYNAFYSNTSGQINSSHVNDAYIVGSVTLTGNPFVDAANGDFDLNTTAGAGAACRGTGRGTFTQTASSYTGTLGYPDMGAVQHQDSGGGGGTTINVFNKVTNQFILNEEF